MRVFATFLAIVFLAGSIAQAEDLSVRELAGTVTTEDGKPIADAIVDPWTYASGDDVRTDKDGHFHLKNLRPGGTIELRISKEGFTPWYQVDQKTGISDLKISLNSKTYFEGVVLSPDGKPVPKVLVRADCGPKQNPTITIAHVWTETTSGPDGHYKLFVSPDSYKIEARDPKVGVISLFATVAEGEAKNQDIALDPGVRFVAHFIDADTGKPIPDVRISLTAHQGAQGVSDHDGQAVIEHAPTDASFVWINSKDYVKWWSEDAINEECQVRPQNLNLNQDNIQLAIEPAMKPVTIQMEKGVVISGHVVDPLGKPVAGATVVTNRIGYATEVGRGERFTTTTKTDGSYAITIPAAGEEWMNLEVEDGPRGHWRDWANGVSDPLQPKPGDVIQDLTISLTAPATISGRVIGADGNPAANKSVRVMSADERDSMIVAPHALTDKDGKYEVKFVRPGDVIVEAEPFHSPKDQDPRHQSASQLVTVKEAEDKTGVDLNLPR